MNKYDRRRNRIKKLCNEIGQEYPACGFDIGDGWFPIVENALKKIATIDVKWKLVQVKQKFCQLRIYIHFLDYETDDLDVNKKFEEIRRLANEAERLCDVACENCGAKVNGGSAWGCKFCSRCEFLCKLSRFYNDKISWIRWTFRRFIYKFKSLKKEKRT